MGLVRGWRLFLTVLLMAGCWSAGQVLAQDSSPAVFGVRVAAHDGVTRFVLDIPREVPFSVAPSDERTLILDLPGLVWKASIDQLKAPVGVLADFRVVPSRPGSSQVLLRTTVKAKVAKAFMLYPGEINHHRLVVDLVPATAQMAAPTPAQPAQPQPAKGAGAGKTTPVGLAVPPAPAGKAEPARPANVKPVVVIDPGHGGNDPGAISVTGAYEKTIVLAMALELKDILEKRGKVTPVLTRDRDVFIPLRERVAKARAANADLFISLHADTVDNRQIRGMSVYTLSQNASDAEAQALADKENKSDIVAGLDLSHEAPEVTNILIDLVQRESMNLSASFATRVIREVKHDTHNVLEYNTHRFAGFAVLKAPDVPSVLIETGYLSNTEDEQMLRRSEYRAKLATALARAIEGFFVQTRKGRR